jgi:valyl-tRNA synthetase
MNFLQSLVEGIRTIRGEMNVPPSVLCTAVINCRNPRHAETIRQNTHFLERLARIGEIRMGPGQQRPKLAATAIVAGEEVFLPLEGLIDVEVERKRLSKEIDRISGLLHGIESKLRNGKFLANAPADVVEKEKAKRENFALTLEKLRANFQNLIDVIKDEG